MLANLDAADQEAAVSLNRWSLKIRESLGVGAGLTARDLMSGDGGSRGGGRSPSPCARRLAGASGVR